MSDNSRHPKCFGKLDIVFPKGKEGLRHTPKECMACLLKTECLRTALLAGQGVTVKKEMVDRAYASGTMGFWKRWSMKKKLEQKKK